ncbi:MAG: LL-diaminopimelate aminotransferase [Chloroflexota bacterium]|nr:LL-diaminopimelate aminotransferase [Chloroflexota bacterium]
MRLSKRMEKLPPYLFVGISRIIAEKRARGEEVISFGIGDPDIPTPQHIIEAGITASRQPVNHRYPETDGLPRLRETIARWYKVRFGVTLDPSKEIVPLIGAKEGIGHMAFCFLDPGDVALVPNPGYPVYSIGTMFAGADTHWLPLTQANNWLPDLDAIPSEVARRAKLLWLNYPNNPTAALAPAEYYQRAIEFARRNDIAIMHDACYSEVYYDGVRPMSFMQVDGAKEVGVEFHSLSKTYNMTGWRIGMAVGNAQMIDALFRLKSNLDSGVPQAIQEMAIAALDGPQDAVEQRNAIYQRRRDKLVAVLNEIGLPVKAPKATFYAWVRAPEGHTSASFATALLEQRSIVVTPGSGYGKYGEGYVRFSLTLSDALLEKGLSRLRGWKIPAPPTGR